MLLLFHSLHPPFCFFRDALLTKDDLLAGPLVSRNYYFPDADEDHTVYCARTLPAV